MGCGEVLKCGVWWGIALFWFGIRKTWNITGKVGSTEGIDGARNVGILDLVPNVRTLNFVQARRFVTILGKFREENLTVVRTSE
jgi:hypothetical protein